MSTAKPIEVWQRIKLGTYHDVGELRRALEEADCAIDGQAKNMLDGPEFGLHPMATSVELVRMTVKDLGFSQAARLLDICARADKLGFDPCPAEVGPQVCLQCKNLFINQDRLIVVMKPILGRCHRSMFEIWREDRSSSGRSLSLCGESYTPDDDLCDWFEVLFVRRV